MQINRPLAFVCITVAVVGGRERERRIIVVMGDIGLSHRCELSLVMSRAPQWSVEYSGSR